MELNLPIKQGERPLFKALDIVQNIYRDYKRNQNVYETIKSETIFNWVAQLYVFIEILRVREQKGMRNNSQDLFGHLLELPLFFKEEQVRAWEVEKKWNNTDFIPYKNILIDYEVSFDTLTPSSLYQAKDKINEHIWQQWLIKTPIKELIETLEYSAKSLLQWEKQRKETTTLQKNLNTLSKYLGLNKQSTKNWYYLQILATYDYSLWNLYLKENKNHDNIKELMSIWEKSFNLENESITSLLYEDSILVNLGFYNPVSKSYTDWKDYWQELEQFSIPNIHKKILKQNNILDLFLKENQSKNVLPLKMFSYLKGLNENIHLINQLKTGKVLIYGKHLSGKKSLAHTILKTLGYKGFSINHKEHKENESKNKFNELRLADKLLSTFKNAALIVENAEENYDLEKNLNFKTDKSLQIWTVSNIEKINSNILRNFDIVLEIEIPPLINRIQLAKFFFKEDSVAARIAQTLKEPFEIIRIGKLCHIAQDWSWSHVNLLISNFNNLESAKNRVNLNKLENTDNIIPLVGYPDLRELLDKLVNYYKNPNKYIEMGAKADKGILLVGPPGTGKTHFVRNLSKIVNIPIFAPETSVLASNLDAIGPMFTELKKQAPCILFLDEIDTLITNPKTFSGVDLAKQKIVNTFLSNIDGIEDNDGVLIVGTTHRRDNFDPAATRSGRLSKLITLSLPNKKARKEIWEAHIKNKKVSAQVNVEELSSLSVSFSCADIMEATNKAALSAVESGKSEIDINDFKIACDETFWGYTDSNIIITEKQKKLTAYHEAGHALLAWKHGYNVQRITIRPRQRALGATHFVGEEGVFSMSMEMIRNKLQVMLGGICAEKITAGYYENGGIGDLESAKKLVYHAIAEAGLGKEGPISLGEPKLWSNERRLRIELEEKEIMEKEFKETEDYLELNKLLLKELADHLLEHKETSGEIMNYFKKKILTSKVNIEKISSKYDEQVLHKNDKK